MMTIDADLIRKMTEKGKRIDGRAFDQYRKMQIETGIISSAEGSARVKLGNTEVIVGVKLGVGTPFPDTPDEGVLMVGAELVPLANPDFESGPPGEDSIELARVVDRAIRESKCIDTKALCITPEEKVWMVFIDIDVIDDHGNLIDAACTAAVAALHSAKMPLFEEEKVNYEIRKDKLPIKGTPISTTFVKINNEILADPNFDEMNAMEARLTIGTIDKDGKIFMCSMQKGGSSGFTVEEIDKITEMAEEKGEEIREKIRKS